MKKSYPGILEADAERRKQAITHDNEPCLHCTECGVPYVEDVAGDLTVNFEPIEEE